MKLHKKSAFYILIFYVRNTVTGKISFLNDFILSNKVKKTIKTRKNNENKFFRKFFNKIGKKQLTNINLYVIMLYG